MTYGKLECRSPLQLQNNTGSRENIVRCGQCVGCILRRKAVWTGRNCAEWFETGSRGSFLTLTYADDPGQEAPYSHIQNFLKRLRLVHQLRFFVAPDTGDRFDRFHWHMLLFGPECDPQFAALCKEKWEHGFIDCRPLSRENIGYTCGYVTKKLDKRMAIGRSRSSLGLGKSFFLRKGAECALERTTLSDRPSSIEVFGRKYPIDRNSRLWFESGYKCAGGVIKYASSPRDTLDVQRIVNVIKGEGSNGILGFRDEVRRELAQNRIKRGQAKIKARQEWNAKQDATIKALGQDPIQLPSYRKLEQEAQLLAQALLEVEDTNKPLPKITPKNPF